MSEPKWTPKPWRYEPGGGHAPDQIVGSDLIAIGGWPEPDGTIFRASYSERVCENLGNPDLPGPAANIALITAAPELYEALEELGMYVIEILGAPNGDPLPLVKAYAAMAKARGETEGER